MKPLYCITIAFCFLFCFGCSSSQRTSDITPPELLYQHPLPAFPQKYSGIRLRIPLEIRITAEGTVSNVRIVDGSGNEEWDSSAAHSIMSWKYKPASIAGTPVAIWIHQTAVIRFSEPHSIHLAEILCGSRDEADSAAAQLERGRAFSEVAQSYSQSSSRLTSGEIGSVNILTYPEKIKKVLAELRTGEWTKPLEYGDQFIIFKRLDD